MSKLHNGVGSFRVDTRDGIDQTHVCRQVNNTQIGRGQHHREVLRIRQVRQNFGVSWIQVPPLMQGFFVQRCCADGVNLVFFGQINGFGEKLECCIPSHGRYFTVFQVRRDKVQINHIYSTEFILGFGRLLNRVNVQT
ncbi:hypothetical protein D3C74_428530 [compost metagenome]